MQKNNLKSDLEVIYANLMDAANAHERIKRVLGGKRYQ